MLKNGKRNDGHTRGSYGIHRINLTGQKNKSGPRRPTYTDEEDRFLKACLDFRSAHHKGFLTAADHLMLLKRMGYRLGCVKR